MTKLSLKLLLFLCCFPLLHSQTVSCEDPCSDVNAPQNNPAVNSWLINTTGETGSHYVEGNSTPVQNNILVNVQEVNFDCDYVYINSTGIPSYIIGPYLDGNPATATDNQHIFKIPLNPQEKTGTKTNTNLGIIATFVNGVPIYDWRDGRSFNNQGVWNQNAIVFEMDGFDCPKGHPSPIFSGGAPGMGTLLGGTYHHHQNPTAFDLDLQILSTVCATYPSDGLYVIDDAAHSPLIGFAFDGFPIYGAYGYANADGTGGIVRIESSYDLRNINGRTHYADGTDVTNGPPISTNFPLGSFAEDFEYTGNGHLDEYNGRFAITPEYPCGTYAYYATVDEFHNSKFPYIIGPNSYYGVVSGGEETSVPTSSTEYTDALCTLTNNLTLTDASVGGSDGAASATIVGATGNISYEWSTGATTSSISGLPAGTYTLTITEGDACICTICEEFVILETTETCAGVDLNILFDGYPSQTSWDITDASGTVVSNGGGYGSMSGNTTTTENTCLTDGCYDLNFYDSLNNGMCPFRSNAVASGTFITPGTTIIAGSIVASFGLGVSPGLCGNFTLADANGTTLVSGGGSFGASNTQTFCLSGGVAAKMSNLENSISRDLLSVYPTLATGSINLEFGFDKETNIELTIYDVNGKVVQQYDNLMVNSWESMQLNIADLNGGSYFIKMNSVEGSTTKRFIKK